MPIYTILLLFGESPVALPIPEDPPVIIATLFLNAVSNFFFFSRIVFFSVAKIFSIPLIRASLNEMLSIPSSTKTVRIQECHWVPDRTIPLYFISLGCMDRLIKFFTAGFCSLNK
jgi:hypothetical protein